MNDLACGQASRTMFIGTMARSPIRYPAAASVPPSPTTAASQGKPTTRQPKKSRTKARKESMDASAKKTRKHSIARPRPGTNKCAICKRQFTPDKWHPKQKVCGRPKCRTKHRRTALSEWRLLNPDYFAKRTDNIETMRQWRKDHPDYYRQYRKAHPEIRENTRAYVQKWRRKLRDNAARESSDENRTV